MTIENDSEMSGGGCGGGGGGGRVVMYFVVFGVAVAVTVSVRLVCRSCIRLSFISFLSLGCIEVIDRCIST